MDNIIVYLDDAAYAMHLLQPMLPSQVSDTGAAVSTVPPSSSSGPTHWILVGCAPRITHRVSKWVTHSARNNWRRKWADKAFSSIVPTLEWHQGTVTKLLADSSLCQQTEALIRQHGASRVLDARRPKLGQDLQPVTAAQVQEHHGLLGFATALAGAGLIAGID